MALPMKSMKGMKGRKAMKSKKVGRGKLAKVMVLKGQREKTSGGLTKESIIKNSRGKAVSKKRSAYSKRRFATSSFKRWIDAVTTARKALSIVGFCAVNGNTAQGKALYAKAKTIYT